MITFHTQGGLRSNIRLLKFQNLWAETKRLGIPQAKSLQLFKPFYLFYFLKFRQKLLKTAENVQYWSLLHASYFFTNFCWCS